MHFGGVEGVGEQHIERAAVALEGGRAAMQQRGNDDLSRVWGQGQPLFSQTFQRFLNGCRAALSGASLSRAAARSTARLAGSRTGSCLGVKDWAGAVCRGTGPCSASASWATAASSRGSPVCSESRARLTDASDSRWSASWSKVRGPCLDPAACGSDLGSNNAVSCAGVRPASHFLQGSRALHPTDRRGQRSTGIPAPARLHDSGSCPFCAGGWEGPVRVM
jgi:hypothetical protein